MVHALNYLRKKYLFSFAGGRILSPEGSVLVVIMATGKVQKRDGAVVDFDREKIVHAIFKAAQSVGGSDRDEAAKTADLVVSYLSKKFKDDYTPNVEEIQDLVEKALIERGHATTAKAYIIYRHRKNVESSTLMCSPCWEHCLNMTGRLGDCMKPYRAITR